MSPAVEKGDFPFPTGTFVCVGKDSSSCSIVRRVLLRWGWTENCDINSDKFDFKWTIGAKLVTESKLQHTKVVNHFPESRQLDNKSSLASTLGQCPQCRQTFFPRQYDLRTSCQLRAFLEDFVNTQAALLLEENPTHAVASRIIQRQENGPMKGYSRLVRSEEEWTALVGSLGRLREEHQNLFAKPNEKDVKVFVEDKVEDEESECRECTARKQLESAGERETSECETSEREATEQVEGTGDAEEEGGGACNIKTKQSRGLASLRSNQSRVSAQKVLDGPANAWAVKNPAANNGKAVRVLVGLENILKESEGRYSNGYFWGCVVQKYLERPLRLQRPGGEAKTDLRLWVLVLSVDPLVAFAYSVVYFRVAAGSFKLDPSVKPEQFAHVTNCRPKDNRMTATELLSELGPKAERDFENRSWPLMLDAVRAVLIAWRSDCGAVPKGKSGRPQGPSAFELFGFDFALDENFHPWLLEVNASPDMLRSCDVKELQKEADIAIESLLGIVLGNHFQTLHVPSAEELKARDDVTEEHPSGSCHAERLFRETLAGDNNHSVDTCYGHFADAIPQCLVRGLNLGPAFGNWRLILREAEGSRPKQQLQKSHARRGSITTVTDSFSGRPPSHRRVLNEMLLPDSFTKRWFESMPADRSLSQPASQATAVSEQSTTVPTPATDFGSRTNPQSPRTWRPSAKPRPPPAEKSCSDSPRRPPNAETAPSLSTEMPAGGSRSQPAPQAKAVSEQSTMVPTPVTDFGFRTYVQDYLIKSPQRRSAKPRFSPVEKSRSESPRRLPNAVIASSSSTETAMLQKPRQEAIDIVRPRKFPNAVTAIGSSTKTAILQSPRQEASDLSRTPRKFPNAVSAICSSTKTVILQSPRQEASDLSRTKKDFIAGTESRLDSEGRRRSREEVARRKMEAEKAEERSLEKIFEERYHRFGEPPQRVDVRQRPSVTLKDSCNAFEEEALCNMAKLLEQQGSWSTVAMLTGAAVHDAAKALQGPVGKSP